MKCRASDTGYPCDLRHGRRLECVNGLKPNGPAGTSTIFRGDSRGAVRWSLSPHPGPLPWGEGELLLAADYNPDLSALTARCALFPLPEGEGQGEGKRVNDPLAYWIVRGTVELDESPDQAGGFPK